MASVKNMRRMQAPTVPANYSERRIIALENFMLHTHLRGEAALAAFNYEQAELAAKSIAPLIEPDPKGLKLKAFFGRINSEIAHMRGSPDYWKWHNVRRG